MKKTIRLNHMFGFLQKIGRNRCWMLTAIVAAMLLIMPMSFGSSAATVSVDVNGSSLYTKQDLLKSGVTYVPLRAFADAVYDGFTISWNSLTRTATVQDGSYTLTAKVGNQYITVNGQRIYSNVSNLLIGNRIHVPIRSLCTAMGLDIDWIASRRLASVSGTYSAKPDAKPPVETPENNGSGNTGIDQDDLYWLARIISAESRGESMAGKIAVGTVVMNRVKSSMYPDTIYGVIFDRKHGVQFTPASNGTIYNEPTAESVEAARRVLAGERTDSRILFFVNEKLAPGNWVSKNRTYIMTIGNHKFYA